MSKNIILITLASLNLRAGTQFREKLDEDAIKTYTEKLKEWKAENTLDAEGKPLAAPKPMSEWSKCPLPPITVFRTSSPDGDINADGFHRVKAAKAAGLEEFHAEIKEGDKADAIKYALGANADHGVHLTRADMHNKLKSALKFEDFSKLSNNGLAKKIGVSEFFVRTNRPASATPENRVSVGKDGKEKATVKTAGIGKKGGKAKAKKAATKKVAKASGKKGAAGTPAAGTPQTEEEKALAGALGGDGGGTDTGKKFDEDTEKALGRIVKALNEATPPVDGAAFDKAIRDGSLELSNRDIKLFAQTSPERIVQAYPLIAGANRLKPAAAFAFLDKATDSETKLKHLFNMTIAARGAVYEKVEGFHVLVVPDDENNVVLRNMQLRSFFYAPHANADAARDALAQA